MNISGRRKLREEAETTIKFLRKRVAKVVKEDNTPNTAAMVPKAHLISSSSDESSQEDSYQLNHEGRQYQTINMTHELDSDHTNSPGNTKGQYNNAFDMDYQLVETQFNHRSGQNEVISDNDTETLLPKNKLKKAKNSEQRLSDLSYDDGGVDPSAKSERALSIALQITFPFLMAGMGMVAAGIVLDKVQVCILVLVYFI